MQAYLLSRKSTQNERFNFTYTFVLLVSSLCTFLSSFKGVLVFFRSFNVVADIVKDRYILSHLYAN